MARFSSFGCVVVNLCLCLLLVDHATDARELNLHVFNNVDEPGDLSLTLTSLFDTVTTESLQQFTNRMFHLQLTNNEHIIQWTVGVSFSDSIQYPLPEPLVTNGSHVQIAIYGSKGDLHLWIRETHYEKPSLGYDQALISVRNFLTYPVNIAETSSDCYKCLEVPVTVVYPSGKYFLIVPTQFKMTYSFLEYNGTSIYRLERHFAEHSSYILHLNETLDAVVLQEEEPGQNANLPILYAAIILIGAFVIWSLGIFVYQRMKRKGLLHFRRVDREISQDLGDPKKTYGAVNSEESTGLLPDKPHTDTGQPSDQKPKKERLKSLDTFRGFSLVIMIFVNYGGGGYWFFTHSTWNGITVADLVFPWFVWIMGVSIVYSFHGRKKDSKWSKLYQIVRRSVILLGLGLFLNNGFHLSHWRIPGVLQRFAVAYFVVALTEFLTTPLYSRYRLKWSVSSVHDLTSNWIQWCIVIILEFIWIMLTFLLEVPGCPRGYLGPGGRSDGGKHWNCTGGAAGHIDHWILSNNHIYQHPTCKKLYDTGSYDPEGILGSINSIVICFLGVQAGRILIYHKHFVSRIIRLTAWGVLLGTVGTILCEGMKDDGLMPLNKNLWSLSFILVTAGMGYLLLCLFYIFIDVIKLWNGAPFFYAGMNSILIYAGHELLEGMFPFGWSGMETSHAEFLSSNIISVGLWVLIAYYWYSIGFFVKI